jgi:hypothetical protein
VNIIGVNFGLLFRVVGNFESIINEDKLQILFLRGSRKETNEIIG